MKQLLIILFFTLHGIHSIGQTNYQGYNYFYKHGDAVTLDSNRGGQFIAGSLRMPFYQTADTTKVFGIDSHGMMVMRTIPVGAPGSGTVTTISITPANGFAATVTNPTTTPQVTLTTTVNGIPKGNGTAFTPAVAGTDYVAPAGLSIYALQLSLADSVQTRVKYSDTASMLSTYAKTSAIPSISGKVNYTDTAAMLTNYERSAHAAATYATIPNVALKLNISDTASMLATYQRTGLAVLLSGSYSNPSWLTSLPWSKITGTPTTLSGYGITDYLTHSGQYLGSNGSGFTWFTPPTVVGTLSSANGSIVLTPASGTGTVVDLAIDTAAGYYFSQRQIDSFILTKGYHGGTVTSVTAGAGLSGGTFTTTGTVSMPNTGTANTYAYPSSLTTDAQGRVSSVTAGSAPTIPTAGYGISSVNPITVDTAYIATRLRLQKVADSLSAIIATKGTGNGTVTSVANGYGTAGGTITTSGSIGIDTALIATRLRVQKQIDSLGVIIATKGSGTVTSVATNTGTGLTGGTITSSGTLANDTTILATRLWRNKAVDSLNTLIAAKGSGTVTGTSVVSANGFAGIVATASTTPAITLTTTVNAAAVAGNGTALIPATTTGTGSTLVLATSGTLVTPLLGTPTSGVLTNCTGLPLTTGVTGILPAANLPTDVAYVDVAQSFTKGQAGTPVTLTDAPAVALDLSLSNNFRVTLGGNRTMGVPTNVLAGQTGYINIWQDITGSRTIVLPWPYSYSAATAPTLSTGKLTMDKLVYAVDYYATSSSITATNATPGVFTWTAHGLVSGQMIQFSAGTTTTPVLATTYWVTVVSANTFNISTSFANAQAGTLVTTSGTSGSLTATACGISTALNTDFRR